MGDLTACLLCEQQLGERDAAAPTPHVGSPRASWRPCAEAASIRTPPSSWPTRSRSAPGMRPIGDRKYRVGGRPHDLFFVELDPLCEHAPSCPGLVADNLQQVAVLVPPADRTQRAEVAFRDARHVRAAAEHRGRRRRCRGRSAPRRAPGTRRSDRARAPWVMFPSQQPYIGSTSTSHSSMSGKRNVSSRRTPGVLSPRPSWYNTHASVSIMLTHLPCREASRSG